MHWSKLKLLSNPSSSQLIITSDHLNLVRRLTELFNNLFSIRLQGTFRNEETTENKILLGIDSLVSIDFLVTHLCQFLVSDYKYSGSVLHIIDVAFVVSLRHGLEIFLDDLRGSFGYDHHVILVVAVSHSYNCRHSLE